MDQDLQQVNAAAIKRLGIVFQNTTPELLSVESFGLYAGVWQLAPQFGQIIAAHNSLRWECHIPANEDVNAGFILLGSTKGYLEITWKKQMAEDLEAQSEAPPRLEAKLITRRETEDMLTLVVILTQKQGAEANSPPVLSSPLFTNS